MCFLCTFHVTVDRKPSEGDFVVIAWNPEWYACGCGACSIMFPVRATEWPMDASQQYDDMVEWTCAPQCFIWLAWTTVTLSLWLPSSSAVCTLNSPLSTLHFASFFFPVLFLTWLHPYPQVIVILVLLIMIVMMIMVRTMMVITCQIESLIAR